MACRLFNKYTFTDAQKTSLFVELNNLPVTSQLYTSIILYTTSLFAASEMPHWIGPGLKFLQNLWNTSPPPSESTPFAQTRLSFALKTYLCLGDTSWGGWKMIALPLVFKSTMKPEIGLIEHPRELIAFLAALKRGKKLGLPGEVDVVWKRKMEALVIERLKSGSWKHDDGVCASLVSGVAHADSSFRWLN